MRKYVIRRKFEKKEKTVEKAPKIQRLVTPLTLQRKRARKDGEDRRGREVQGGRVRLCAPQGAAPAGAEGGAALRHLRRRKPRREEAAESRVACRRHAHREAPKPGPSRPALRVRPPRARAHTVAQVQGGRCCGTWRARA